MNRSANNHHGHERHTLIDDLLAEQRQLTAVERFSRAHDSHELRSRIYRDLLPATPPAPGQQYAFEVNLDQCTGCKACVSACHSLNGLDDDETWRAVGLLASQPSTRIQQPFQQNITTACHHCVDPGCLNGCPVLAYDKDPLTGIVRHLDDQCIGCQYCVMMCPYEVPQYSKARGIVRKCDMCHSRLAVGEAPACVQACPTSAIKITVLEQAKVRGKYRVPNDDFRMTNGGRNLKPPFQVSSFNPRTDFLPASPNPAITLPTTRFVTQRIFPETVLAGDHAVVRRAGSHLPLVILLVLSQLAIGASVAALVVQPALPLLIGSLVSGVAAMMAGSLHLGQPLKAWRSFLGWRKSWFSREVIALGLFVGAVAGALLPILHPLFCILAAVFGLITVTCSAMIYVDTRREFWRAGFSFTKFFGTTLLLGLGAAFAVLLFSGGSRPMVVATGTALVLAAIAKLSFEQRIFRELVDDEVPGQTPLNKTARLIAGELNGYFRARVLCGLVGGVVLPALTLLQVLAKDTSAAGLALVALVFCTAGELLERYLFFTAVVTQKMPGAIAE